MAIGKCVNISKPCSKAINREEIEADKANFVCPECGKPLVEIQGKSPKKKGDDDTGGGINKKLFGIIGAAIIVLASGGFGGWYFINNSVEEPVINKIELDKKNITLIVGDSPSEMLMATVYDQKGDEMKDVKLVFTTGDETVATVTQNGEVTAVKKGNTSITVKIDGKENLSTACQVEVIEKNEDPIPPEEPDPTPPVDTRTSGKVGVGYGTYDGPLSNGKAHGIGGEIIVTSTYTIDLKKASGETVTVHRGDKIMNVKMENGRFRQGEIHFTDGTRKFISGL